MRVCLEPALSELARKLTAVIIKRIIASFFAEDTSRLRYESLRGQKMFSLGSSEIYQEQPERVQWRYTAGICVLGESAFRAIAVERAHMRATNAICTNAALHR